jgi:hypothetical protein
MTMLNLILTVILEAGATAAAEDEHGNAVQLQKKMIKAQKKLIEMCKGLDTDGSGSLSYEEFMKGYNSHMEFKDAMQTMHVSETDVRMVFNICDEDGSGDVNYHEFVAQLQRMKESGEKMLLYYVTDIRQMVTKLKFELNMKTSKEARKMSNDQPKDLPLEPKAGVDISENSLLPIAAKELSRRANEDPSSSRSNVDVRRVLPEKGKIAPFTMSQEAQQQALQILQSSPGIGGEINSDALQRLMKLSEDLVTIMAEVNQQSTVQTNLLHTLVGENRAARPFTPCCVHDEATLPKPSMFACLTPSPPSRAPTPAPFVDVEVDPGGAGSARNDLDIGSSQAQPPNFILRCDRPGGTRC